ncbi:Uncharacterised protein [Serratia liquefaciens]|uniref:DUF6602 domain-containing protein n=1 Tax=Serratia liquefaciens TaxID=614 RepID=UPI0021787F73|nr:DUF6602 domain-containing protein [Serratia liquefaciens]CAI0996225.1 Uncharacterised protein [Serratia liquefaciens]CAI1521523.1 Uncharacterised protein [Serratia liquefaciens]
MIKNLAELLQAFMNEETAKLNKYQLKHGPTIGDMYEGLSSEILNRAIPPQLNLKIVNGFITDGNEGCSGQMDCMLVRGEGEKIPYTDSYKWHVKDVLVVFEVKKNLYSADLINSFRKLRQVSENYSSYLFEGEHDKENVVNLSPSYRTFSQITGITAPHYHERETLTKENELIYTTIFMEQLTPVTIVLGYNGYSSEYSLREGLVRFLEEEGNGYGYGVPSFPQLIICDKYSLIKGNGRPYSFRMRDDYWDFMMSSKANPVLLMLELIWTKISLELDIIMPWGDGLEVEVLNNFLRAKPVVHEEQGGWMLKYDELSNDLLESRQSSEEWQPVEVTQSIYSVFTQLDKHDICVADPEFVQFAVREFGDVNTCIGTIISTSLASFDGEFISLTSDHITAISLHDGRFIIAGDNLGRLNAWLEKYNISSSDSQGRS